MNATLGVLRNRQEDCGSNQERCGRKLRALKPSSWSRYTCTVHRGLSLRSCSHPDWLEVGWQPFRAEVIRVTCVRLFNSGPLCRWTYAGALKEAVVCVEVAVNPSIIIIPSHNTRTHGCKHAMLCRCVDISRTVDKGTVRISVTAAFLGVCPFVRVCVCQLASFVRPF